MRVALSTALLASTIGTGSAFAFAGTRSSWGDRAVLFSTVEADAAEAAIINDDAAVVQVLNVDFEDKSAALPSPVTSASASAEIKSRLDKQLAKLREKDATSKRLTKEDLQVVYDDDHILVVNKPSGVLTVSAGREFPSLAEAVSDAFGCGLGSPDHMVVHRLGMDTSGLLVLAKTTEGVRGMNAIFRNREIERKYEALVCGVVEKESGLIDLPIMRDCAHPPYVRISTEEQQKALIDLDPEVVGKKLLELPRESITKYEVVAREEFDGQPVTRLTLTSISGRYHQLNVHLAAFGHPIVGDTTYGIDGAAAGNGGLSEEESDVLLPNPSRATVEVQQAVARAASVPCVHAKSLKFRHPVTAEEINLACDAPW